MGPDHKNFRVQAPGDIFGCAAASRTLGVLGGVGPGLRGGEGSGGDYFGALGGG